MTLRAFNPDQPRPGVIEEMIRLGLQGAEELDVGGLVISTVPLIDCDCPFCTANREASLSDG